MKDAKLGTFPPLTLFCSLSACPVQPTGHQTQDSLQCERVSEQACEQYTKVLVTRVEGSTGQHLTEATSVQATSHTANAPSNLVSPFLLYLLSCLILRLSWFSSV